MDTRPTRDYFFLFRPLSFPPRVEVSPPTQNFALHTYFMILVIFSIYYLCVHEYTLRKHYDNLFDRVIT